MKSILISIGFSILKRVARHIWDAFWLVVKEAVQHAEDKWAEEGYGLIRKDWVLETALNFLETHTKLNWLTRMAVKVSLGHILDSVIKDLNDKFGHGWRAKVKDLKEYLEIYIPIL